jgi:hypothetical protein
METQSTSTEKPGKNKQIFSFQQLLRFRTNKSKYHMIKSLIFIRKSFTTDKIFF